MEDNMKKLLIILLALFISCGYAVEKSAVEIIANGKNLSKNGKITIGPFPKYC